MGVVDEEQGQGQAEERFAANLRTARERAGLSQQALAVQMRNLGFPHIRQQTIAQIEGGSRSVRLGEALALSGIIQTTIDALVRPAGLARDAWELLHWARELREASRAFSEWADRLRALRKFLWITMSRIERDGIAEQLADEVSVARRADRDTRVELLRTIVVEELERGPGISGYVLSDRERARLLWLANALLSIAEDGSPLPGPVTAAQEAAWRKAAEDLAEAERVLAELRHAPKPEDYPIADEEGER